MLPNDTDEAADVVNPVKIPGGELYPDTVCETNPNTWNPGSVCPAAPLAMVMVPDIAAPAAFLAAVPSPA